MALYVVERSGRVITLANPDEFPQLPYLIGDGAPQDAAELVDAVAQHRAVVGTRKCLSAHVGAALGPYS